MTATTIDHRTYPRPEEEFADVDLLDLYRRLNDAGEWTTVVIGGCLAFLAAVQDGRELPSAPAQATYRKMLRRLLELELTGPPRGGKKRRSATIPAARGKTRAMPS